MKNTAGKGKLYFCILGAVTGIANGLFGSGGGIIAVPMLKKSGLSTKEAHATSIALTLPLSIVSCLFYYSIVKDVFTDTIPVIIAGLAGSLLGGIIMKKSPQNILKSIRNTSDNFRDKVVLQMNILFVSGFCHRNFSVARAWRRNDTHSLHDAYCRYESAHFTGNKPSVLHTYCICRTDSPYQKQTCQMEKNNSCNNMRLHNSCCRNFYRPFCRERIYDENIFGFRTDNRYKGTVF